MQEVEVYFRQYTQTVQDLIYYIAISGFYKPFERTSFHGSIQRG